MNEPTEEARNRLEAILEKHVVALGEHFENIQIFVNSVEEGADTFFQLTHGSGNWHARQNHVREWVIMGEEIARCKARRNCEEDGDD